MADRLVDAADLEAFQQIVGSAPAAVVHFWASWCEPCKHLDNILAQLASENQSAKFVRVEAEEVADVSEKYDVSAVPFFLFFKNGAVVDRLEGANPGELSKNVALHLKDTGTANGFPTKPSTPAPAATPSSVKASTSKEDLHAKLTALVKSRPVLLFMKGNPDAPRCGFSSKVVAALKEENVPFGSFDILGDEEVRQGMKEFSNWPTFPQLYVNGELVGGCDIILEMHQSGELKELFEKEGVLTVDKVTTSETKVTDSEQVQDKGVVEGGKSKLDERLEKLVNSKPVVLFMKGTPEAPRCGFSQKVVKALREEGVDFGSFDILSDEEVRQGLKAYSNWPTYPQLYSKGELVGGCDIILEMHESGELKEALTG